MNNELIILTNRSLVSVSGKDSEDFLQSIITIDLSGNGEELLSSCFLSPQGKLLNQFFVKKEENYFLLDLHKKSFQSFIEKMQMYKLNSDVNFEEKNDLEVVICLEKEFQSSFIDPRNKDLGWRGIRKKSSDKSNSDNYEKCEICLESYIVFRRYPLETSKIKFRTIGNCFARPLLSTTWA